MGAVGYYLINRLYGIAGKFSASYSNFRLGQFRLAEDRQDFSMTILVENDNNFPVQAQAVNVEILDTNSNLVIGEGSAQGIEIPADGSATVPVSGSIVISAASTALINLLAGDSPIGSASLPKALIRVMIKDRWYGPFSYQISM